MRALRHMAVFALAATACFDILAQPAGGVSTLRAAPAIRQDVFRELRTARQCTADGDFECAGQTLQAVLEREDLNSYERAQTWYSTAYLDFSRNDHVGAIEAYENMLSESDAPLGLVRSARYALATLYAEAESFDEALASLDGWALIASPATPDPHILRARIQYGRRQFEASIEAVDRAFEMAAERGIEPEEDWYKVRAASLQARGDLAAAAEVLETVVARWPTRDNHIQLAGLYSQLGNDARKRELYETAYASGWLVSGVDLIVLASFRLEAGRLQDALNVLEQNRDRGYLPDGDSLRVLIARVREWASGLPVADAEREVLVRNARLEQQQADRPRRLRF